MIFDNEEERLAYHKTNEIMQALALALEGLCFSYGQQMRLHKIINQHSVVFRISLGPEALTELEGHMNTRYPRTDGLPSCMVLDLDQGLVSVYGRSGKDLTTLA